LVLEADRAKFTTDREDICYVTARIVDEQGTVVPSATQPVTFSLSGPGRILAVDNGALDSHELFQTNCRSAFRGQCVAIMQSSGKPGRITLSASTESLPAAECALLAR
jgi:beta-galactosidase